MVFVIENPASNALVRKQNVYIQSTGAKTPSGASARELVVYLICKRVNLWIETFRCKACQCNYFYISHQDPSMFLSAECSSKQQAEQKAVRYSSTTCTIKYRLAKIGRYCSSPCQHCAVPLAAKRANRWSRK